MIYVTRPGYLRHLSCRAEKEHTARRMNARQEIERPRRILRLMYGLGALLRGDRGFIANYLINFRGRAQSRLLGVKTRARLWGFIVERRSQAPFVYRIWYVCVCVCVHLVSVKYAKRGVLLGGFCFVRRRKTAFVLFTTLRNPSK